MLPVEARAAGLLIGVRVRLPSRAEIKLWMAVEPTKTVPMTEPGSTTMPSASGSPSRSSVCSLKVRITASSTFTGWENSIVPATLVGSAAGTTAATVVPGTTPRPLTVAPTTTPRTSATSTSRPLNPKPSCSPAAICTGLLSSTMPPPTAASITVVPSGTRSSSSPAPTVLTSTVSRMPAVSATVTRRAVIGSPSKPNVSRSPSPKISGVSSVTAPLAASMAVTRARGVSGSVARLTSAPTVAAVSSRNKTRVSTGAPTKPNCRNWFAATLTRWLSTMSVGETAVTVVSAGTPVP